ncbi:ATP-binding protein, partial [Bacteroides heparinolyticus]
GIPADMWEQVFIPFFTTKAEGTGIGLSLCKEIIRRHEGHLFILESRKGKTVFRIQLP